MPRLVPGDAFPDLKLSTVDGPVDLHDRWVGRPLIVTFMRHFGCAFCREHLIQMGRAWTDIRDAGADAVAIFQYRAESTQNSTQNFCRARKVPFDCLGDPERKGYAAVGLERGKRREYLGAKVARGWLRAARSGAVIGVPHGDIALRPATFVLAPGGRVVLAHYNEDSTDNPPVERLLAAIRTIE